ncbi:MAG: hypothetical protein F4051_15540 [Boseongicola sp. SB0670_bin_30]|nr:hypothetical protein [Boseongicola sp. SB0670_bin_30]
MAELGPESHSTGGAGAILGCEPNQVAATRAQLPSHCMFYSQRREESAFAVPMYDEFMKRQMPMLDVHLPKERSRTVIQQERLAVHGSTVSKEAVWNGGDVLRCQDHPVGRRPDVQSEPRPPVALTTDGAIAM